MLLRARAPLAVVEVWLHFRYADTVSAVSTSKRDLIRWRFQRQYDVILRQLREALPQVPRYHDVAPGDCGLLKSMAEVGAAGVAITNRELTKLTKVVEPSLESLEGTSSHNCGLCWRDVAVLECWFVSCVVVLWCQHTAWA